MRAHGTVWSCPNIFAYGVPFRFGHDPDTGPGLTDAGGDLARLTDCPGDATGLPRLFDALRHAGYGDGSLTGIAHRNWLSLLERTWGA